MDFVLILYAQIISLLLQITSSQYSYLSFQNAFYQNPFQNPYQNFPVEGFGGPPNDYEDQQKYERKQQIGKPSGRSGNYYREEDYNEESEECKCTCNRCDDPEPCCKKACNNCNSQTQPNQQNVVIVPYPYPFVVTPKTTIQSPTTTQSSTTTESPTTTTQAHEYTRSGKYADPNAPMDSPQILPLKNDPDIYRTNYMMTSLRRTKPVWLPKYGIVPIPDRLAEKLMSKLREVKGIKESRRKRMIDPY